MSTKHPSYRTRPGRKPQPGRRNGSLLIMLLGAVAVLGVVVVAAWSGWFATAEGTGTGATIPPQSGVDRAAGVEVDMASIDLGSVPLDTAVEHKFKLRNTSDERATLGRVSIAVLEGC